jgi:hypothetical protein
VNPVVKTWGFNFNGKFMGFYSDSMGYSWDIPSGYLQNIAMENRWP